MSHFLSQCSHESGGFKNLIVTENLKYSVVGLRTTFKKYFPTDEMAKQYERQEEKIANLVYANRNGNGTVESGDGFKYRGRGFIQLTGKSNYAAFNKFVPEDILDNPDLVATKYPMLSAAFFWRQKNLNSRADRGDSASVVTEVTKVVNGGFNGLEDRKQKFNNFISLA
jgi:putative chitinase